MCIIIVSTIKKLLAKCHLDHLQEDILAHFKNVMAPDIKEAMKRTPKSTSDSGKSAHQTHHQKVCEYLRTLITHATDTKV